VDKDGDQVLTAKRMNGLYYVNSDGDEDCKASAETERIILLQWHRRLGHFNFKDLVEATRSGVYKDLNVERATTRPECNICPRGKYFHRNRNVPRLYYN